jgi:hypothetical protein
MFLSNFFFKLRLRAIENSSIVINSNPFSGHYSLTQIEKARKNREMNRKWFVRNYSNLKTKLTDTELKKNS